MPNCVNLAYSKNLDVAVDLLVLEDDVDQQNDSEECQDETETEEPPLGSTNITLYSFDDL